MNGLHLTLLVLLMVLFAVLVPSPVLTGGVPGVSVYGICVAISAAVAALLAAWLRRGDKPDTRRVPLGELLLCCTAGAFIGARLLFCAIRFDMFLYWMGPAAIVTTWTGGFLLYGALLGAMLAAAMLAKRHRVSVASTLDELAAPGLAAIAISRLGEWTTGEGVGVWVESEAFMRLPFAVGNEYGEWQLAVFLWEAAAAFVILLVVLWLRGRKRGEEQGELFMSALVLYACCQIVFESLRQDGCLRIGFVRVSQVLSACAVMGVTLARALRRGEKKGAALHAVIILLCVGAVGGIEWALDKTVVSNRLLYAGMVLSSGVMAFTARRAGRGLGGERDR